MWQLTANCDILWPRYFPIGFGPMLPGAHFPAEENRNYKYIGTITRVDYCYINLTNEIEQLQVFCSCTTFKITLSQPGPSSVKAVTRFYPIG